MLSNMNLKDINGDYKQTTLTLFNGAERVVYYTDIETPYPDGKLIVSTTDKLGVITHANKAFIDMSGYSEEELIGVPHAILRHPDMPAAAYRDLWDTVRCGDKWQGFVKNLRKDGGYYWVKATVIPNIRNGKLMSYTSVRRKPSRNKIEEHIKLYTTLR